MIAPTAISSRFSATASGSSRPVVVVGGGWAGLAAAVELVRHGVPVTLLESARQLGGRARCVRFEQQRVDNGQHIMIGAYRETLRLLEIIGVEESAVFLRRPLRLRMLAPGGGMRLSAARLPAPLHLAAGLLTAGGLPLRDKLRAIRFWQRLQRDGFVLERDISVADLLARHQQSRAIRTNLWEPLCLATLNTAPRDASAQVFIRVLQDAFTGSRRDSDLLIPRTDLGAILPEPALDFIERHGGRVMLGRRVTGLKLRDGRIAALELAEGELEAEHAILAVPHMICQRLLAPHAPLKPIADRLAELTTEPICTVYLQYPRDTRLPDDMAGLTGGTAQWVFDHAQRGQPGVMAVVISADGPHMDMDNTALARQVAAELARIFPHWPAPEGSLVIREKRATFACRVDSHRLRPAHATPVQGCWLAGDYTATELPATLEGAVRSGVQCARAVVAKSPNSGVIRPVE